MERFLRKEVVNLKPYIPGKPVDEVKKELGLEDIIKLASNENPLGPSKLAVEAIKEAASEINIYPDPLATNLRMDLAAKFGVSSDEIVVGNGGEEILKMIAMTFINEGDEAIMATPSFSAYSISVEHMGGIPVEIPLKNFKHDFEAFINKINNRTKLVYVCNPNNPTGNIMTKEELDFLFNNIPQDLIVVLDEAYYEYAVGNPDYPDSVAILKKRPNTIIMRTFSKVVGLAGTRVGYGITSVDIVREMNKVKGVFNVNHIAQAAARAALRDSEHINKTVELNSKSLGMMAEYFNQNNIQYVDSEANFIFVDLGIDSKLAFNELLKMGVIVRPGFIWNMNTWIRVSSGTIEETERFIKALDELLKKVK